MKNSAKYMRNQNERNSVIKHLGDLKLMWFVTHHCRWLQFSLEIEKVEKTFLGRSSFHSYMHEPNVVLMMKLPKYRQKIDKNKFFIFPSQPNKFLDSPKP